MAVTKADLKALVENFRIPHARPARLSKRYAASLPDLAQCHATLMNAKTASCSCAVPFGDLSLSEEAMKLSVSR